MFLMKPSTKNTQTVVLYGIKLLPELKIENLLNEINSRMLAKIQKSTTQMLLICPSKQLCVVSLSKAHYPLVSRRSAWEICLFCCFTSQVNSYGHGPRCVGNKPMSCKPGVAGLIPSFSIKPLSVSLRVLLSYNKHTYHKSSQPSTGY